MGLQELNTTLGNQDDYFCLHHTRGPLHKTFTGEKTLVKSENSGKHEFTIDFTIGRKLRLK